MTCDSDNHGLVHLPFEQIVFDLVWCLIAIHNGHTAVHEYEPVGELASLVGFYHFLNGLFPVRCLVDIGAFLSKGVAITVKFALSSHLEVVEDDSHCLLDHYFQPKQIVRLIVNNQNLLVQPTLRAILWPTYVYALIALGGISWLSKLYFSICVAYRQVFGLRLLYHRSLIWPLLVIMTVLSFYLEIYWIVVWWLALFIFLNV